MKNLAFIICVAFSINLSSQNTSGGPDNFGYTYKSSLHPNGPTYQWFDISTIGTLVFGLSDDNFVGPFPMSGFPYYSTNPTQFYIGSNGYISFQPVNIASSNAQFPAIPIVGAPDNYIAPFLTDLNFAGSSSNPSTAYYYDQGDTICVTFEKVPFWVNNTTQYSGDNSFQVILNKADSSITFNYKTQIGTPDPTYVNNFISIGIENNTGNDGLLYYRGDSFPNPNTSIRFEYPNITQPITDIEVDYINNETNGAVFVSKNGIFTPSVSLKNSGNQNVGFTVRATTQITNPTGAIVYSNAITIDSLLSGDDSLKSFTSYSPLDTGKYLVKSFIDQVAGDGIRSNDTSEMYFIVVDTTRGTQTLDYTSGTSGFGIGWNGGNGGCAVYIEPPYYPAQINASNFWITTVGTPPAGFHAVIYDDNGRGPGQGTVLDSNFINSTSISTNQYNRVPTNNPIVISSGGIYLLWLMDGPNVNLGRNFVTPASRRTYEIILGSWSEYRDNTTQDFKMNIEISPITVDLKDVELTEKKFNIYPNPSKDNVTVNLTNGFQPTIIEVLDINGKIVDVKVIKLENQLRVFRSGIPSGTYFLRLDKQVSPIIFTD